MNRIIGILEIEIWNWGFTGFQKKSQRDDR